MDTQHPIYYGVIELFWKLVNSPSFFDHHGSDVERLLALCSSTITSTGTTFIPTALIWLIDSVYRKHEVKAKASGCQVLIKSELLKKLDQSYRPSVDNATFWLHFSTGVLKLAPKRALLMSFRVRNHW